MVTKQNTLLSALVAPNNKKRKKGHFTFEAAMTRMGIRSVFDIVRLSKADFVRQLAKLNAADGELAYNNAQAYATLLARLRREHLTSSGTYEPRAEHSGIRTLVPLGPTYPKLFNENWSQFCKVGALAADDSPVAYLSALRVFIRQLESTSSDPTRLLLDERRADLKTLLITPESTFTPRPMLDIVNQVLGDNLGKYLKTQPADADKSVHQVLSERQYPFELPYNFYHHQCQLGLSGDKPGLGELNYRVSYLLPIEQTDSNAYGAVQQPTRRAQHLMSGLSPQQQALLIAQAPFSHFYLTRTTMNAGWEGPGATFTSPHKFSKTCFLLPSPQPHITSINPTAHAPTSDATKTNSAQIKFQKVGQEQSHALTFASSAINYVHRWSFNVAHKGIAVYTSCIDKTSELPVATVEGLNATFDLLITDGATPPVAMARQRITLTLDDTYSLTSVQKLYLHNTYGTEASGDPLFLSDLNNFMAQTGLHAEQVEMLLSRHAHSVRVSPNYRSTNTVSQGLVFPGNPQTVLPYPHANHYGSCYVNGVGSDRYDTVTPTTPLSTLRDQFDNAMGLEQTEIGESTLWHLTKTSLDRFDRLQRMIRLQRWTTIPFRKLDTLIMGAIRAEGADNAGMELNENTLRVLGVYRYLDQRHGIDPEAFAALMHHLPPYTSSKDEVSLFDQVFNSNRMLETPLVLDQTVFTLIETTPASRTTMLQLCAGLGLQLTQDSFLLIAAQTQRLLGSLKRDLPTVSSLFRQARIAQLFGCSVAELLTLASLLGGQLYKDVLAKGTLHPPSKAHTPDILDVLMQLQWAMDWLHDSQQSIAQLKQRLGPVIPLIQPHSSLGKPSTGTTDPEPLSDALSTRLSKLQQDTEFSRATAEQITRLNLPTHNNTSIAINWFALLINWYVLDSTGLLIGLDEPLALQDDPKAWLGIELDKLLASVSLSNDAKRDSKEKLLAFLLDTHDRQLQLLLDLFQETTTLPVDRTVAVIHWANTSPYAILVEARSLSTLLVDHFQRVARHAEIAVHWRLSNQALRMFICNRSWLGHYPIANSEPSLADLYLFERFSHWLNSQNQAEDALLSYFSIANPTTPKRTSKQRRLQISAAANEELAKLLGWSTIEVVNLTMLLPDAVARSMEQVDWVRRCQAACNASGLSATAMLQATALTASSTLDAWRAVGEAVAAANTSAPVQPQAGQE